MTIALYMDHNIPRAITLGLRLRDIDVLIAYEDDSHSLPDRELLDRARELGRVLFTQDDDLIREANGRQRAGIPFAGVIYAHQLRVSIGRCIQDLVIICQVGEPEDLADRIEFLPL